MRHELKTDGDVFQAVLDGRKTYELRFDDRDYKIDDELLLREVKYTGEEMRNGKPLVYTGSAILVRVTHILRGPAYGLMEGWVIMSIIRAVKDSQE
ncbi:protein of unknown function [Syntrophus gentianae]|uniref:DUF3850 domain-containing protein n=1 Tax=Syntrophus gentianae TaxID=43775 RepID=A0A1H8BL08_9BACT|nr:DUF3850 domain-containing protein [Syntrophus gentianae]SEM82567.1 protein of unknown function [Syntrophus gentianae]